MQKLERWYPLAAFLLIAGVGGYAIAATSQRDAELLHRALTASCERANDRAEESNQRTAVIEEVLSTAADSLDERAELHEDHKAARLLRNQASRYRELVGTLEYVPPVDCEEAVPHP